MPVMSSDRKCIRVPKQKSVQLCVCVWVCLHKNILGHIENNRYSWSFQLKMTILHLRKCYFVNINKAKEVKKEINFNI